jgi:hypothetical protein
MSGQSNAEGATSDNDSSLSWMLSMHRCAGRTPEGVFPSVNAAQQSSSASTTGSASAMANRLPIES